MLDYKVLIKQRATEAWAKKVALMNEDDRKRKEQFDERCKFFAVLRDVVFELEGLEVFDTIMKIKVEEDRHLISLWCPYTAEDRKHGFSSSLQKNIMDLGVMTAYYDKTSSAGSWYTAYTGHIHCYSSSDPEPYAVDIGVFMDQVCWSLSKVAKVNPR